ncbi:MAG: glycosyltransferase [Lutibacter sp.]|nr:glycosyltransferase [Lutibacter sp.]
MSLYINSDEDHFRITYDSIMSQTFLPNQIVIVFDGPVKFNVDKLLNKQTIQHDIVRLDKNKGLSIALNEGLKIIKNDYVFRVDTDDILTPDRFQIQYEFMSNNDDVAILGGQMNFIGDNGKPLNIFKNVPLTNYSIRKFILFKNPFNHPTVVYRKSIIDLVGGYDHVQYYEDWYLWWKISKIPDVKFVNLQNKIVHYRVRSLTERSGTRFLKFEFLFYKKLYDNKFINIWIFIIIIMIKLPIKIMPKFVFLQAKKIYSKI